MRFYHTIKHLGDNELVFAKGVHPHSYMQSRQQFEYTALLFIEAFHDMHNDKGLELTDYDRAQRT